MLIDKRIHRHIDAIDIVEEKMVKEIDRIYSALSIDEIMANPEESLMQATGEIFNLFERDFALDAISLGINFAKEIKDAKDDIVIPDTEDSNLNRGIDV
jgi:hypothetical protein